VEIIGFYNPRTDRPNLGLGTGKAEGGVGMVKRLPVILACLALISGLVPALAGGVASDAPVVQAQAGTWTTYANGDNVVALAIDGHYLWAATYGGGVVRWDITDGSYVQYLYPQSGLASNDVRAIAIDEAGRVWVGTDRGVSVFDGSAWTTYNVDNSGLACDEINAIAVDGDGRVWFGTGGGGVSVFDGITWTTYNEDNSGLFCDNVTAIAIDASGNAWFAGGLPAGGDWWTFGVSFFNGTTWTVYPTIKAAVEAHYEAILTTVNKTDLWTIQSPDKIWIKDDGVSVFDGSTWTTHTFENTSQRIQVTTVTKDTPTWSWKVPVGFASREEANLALSSGYIVFGTDPTIYRYKGYNPEASSIYIEPSLRQAVSAGTPVYALEVGLLSNDITAIAFDDLGRAWIGTWKGLNLFDGSNWINYTAENTARRGNQVATVIEDAFARDSSIRVDFAGREEANAALSSGYVMFGTAPEVYLYLYNYYRYTGHISISPALWRDVPAGTPVYAVEVGLPRNHIAAITFDSSGRLWLATGMRYVFPLIGRGVTAFDGSAWATYTTAKSGLASNEIYAIAIDGAGQVWFGHRRGVSKFDGAAWTNYPTIKAAIEANYSDILTTVNKNSLWTVQAPDKVWTAEDERVSVFDGSAWTTYNVDNSGLAYEINAIAVDGDGRVWFGTGGGGVSVFDGSAWIHYNSKNSGLASDGVNAIAVGKDAKVWIGTGWSGIPAWETPPPGISVFDGTGWTTYSKSDGLASDWTITIAVDDAGQVWCGNGAIQELVPIVTSQWIGEDGVSVFDGTTWTAYTVKEYGLAPGSVSAIAFDGRGNVWVGNSGVNIFDGDTWTTYTKNNSGLVGNRVKAIAVDGAGNVWFGTLDGVSKFTPADFSISASPSFQSVAPGEAAQFEISLTAQGGFASPITLGVSELPAHTEATFDPNPITPPGSSTLSISTAAQTPPGTYPLTIEASGGGISHTTTATLKIASQYKLYLPFISKNYTFVTRLTYDPARDWQPFFSPDGSWIAFCSDRTGNYDVYLMERGVWSPINLTSSPGDEDVASFSPDGKTIAFASDRSGDWEVYLMDRDGSNVRNISRSPSSDDARPRFSPDGKWIAFDSNRDGNWEIYIMDTSGGNVRRLTHHPARDRLPSFSPDGNWIVFRSERDGNSEVYVMDTDGGNLRRLTDNPAFDGYPSFSPDGTRILFETDRDGNREIYLMDVDGSNPVNLTKNLANDITPSFSPDGRWIVFTSERDGNREIYLMPLAVGASAGAYRPRLGR